MSVAVNVKYFSHFITNGVDYNTVLFIDNSVHVNYPILYMLPIKLYNNFTHTTGHATHTTVHVNYPLYCVHVNYPNVQCTCELP